MEKDRKNKIIALSALVVGVVALSVGFAAFTRSLTVNSSASYNPASSDLEVSFSTSESGIVEGTVTATGTAQGDAISLTKGTGSITSVTGLNAKFTEKGQSSTYSFYIYNDSDYTAFLNSATMANVGTSPVKCTAGTGTNAEMVASACNDISLSVKVGSVEMFKTPSTFTATSIASNTGVPVEITISYAGENTIPDGAFNVEFGTLTLAFSSAQA